MNNADPPKCSVAYAVTGSMRLRKGRKPGETEREMGNEADADSLQPTLPGEVLGGGGWTRTSDLRIMRPSL